MYEDCIQNFLNKSHPSCVDRHSDSSDFGETEPPNVAPKRGAYKLLRPKHIHLEPKKKSLNNQHCIDGENENYVSCLAYKKRTLDTKIANKIIHSIENSQNNSYPIKRSNGDIDYSRRLEKSNNKICVMDKLIPCVVVKDHRINSCSKDKSEAENDVNERKNLTFYHYRPGSMKRIKHGSENYTIRPIYIVERTDNNVDQPFKSNDKGNNKRSQSNAVRENITAFLESEREIKHKMFIPIESNRTDNGNKKCYENSKTKAKNGDKIQQCSKLHSGAPYHVYKVCCKSQSSSTDAEETKKLSSSSSAFWNFLANKIHRKYSKHNNLHPTTEQTTPYCTCQLKGACDPYVYEKPKANLENCDSNAQKPNLKYVPEVNIPKQPSSEVQCKCYSNSNVKSSNKNGGDKPCQEAHSAVLKAVAAKYNGEILCIHNPPCILINGCLNLPPATKSVQSNFWPVATETKRRSFSQICKKMKKSKYKDCNQNSQCNLPRTQIEDYLPEFQLEEDLRNLCPHIPPCPIVHSCFGGKQQSHIDRSGKVPLHENVPECLVENESSKSKICDEEKHEASFDSKKYFTMNFEHSKAKSKSKKTKSKSKMCHHKPPCILVPRCIKSLMSNSHLREGAVPDCTHRPYCEKVPACCVIDTETISALQCSRESCRIV